MKYKDKRKCHVRRGLFNKYHPTAIVGETKDKFIYKGMSHENYKNRYIKLKHNPDKTDKRPSYIDKKSKLKDKKKFSKKMKSWKFDKSDYDKL